MRCIFPQARLLQVSINNFKFSVHVCMHRRDRDNQLIRIKSLDGLRGIAALGISVFCHYMYFKPQHGYPFHEYAVFFWFYDCGWTLVDFFFLLSGFVFTYVYREQISNRTIDFRKYMVLRLSRLYPLHLATLLFIACIQYIRTGAGFGHYAFEANDGINFLLSASLLQEVLNMPFSFNGPSWSISCEFVAYIFFFIITKYLFKTWLYRPLLIVFIVAAITMIMLFLFSGLNFLIFNPFIARVGISFFLGSLLYDFNEYLQGSYSKNAILLLLCVVVCAAFLDYRLTRHSFLCNYWVYWVLFYSLIVFPSIILIVINTDFLSRFFSSPTLVYLGAISYSIYLINIPVQISIDTSNVFFNLHINYSSPYFFIFYVAMLLTMSSLSYTFFESKIKNTLRQGIINRKG